MRQIPQNKKQNKRRRCTTIGQVGNSKIINLTTAGNPCSKRRHLTCSKHEQERLSPASRPGAPDVVHGSGENAHRERLPKPPARWYRLRARDDDERSIHEEKDKAERKRVRMTGGVISNRPSRFRRPNYWTSHQ